MLAVRLSGNRLFTRFAAHRLLPLLAVIATLGFAGGLVIARPVSVLVGFALLGAGLGSVVPMTLRAAGAVGNVNTGKSGRLGGRLWLGRLRRGTGRDRRNRIIDDTAHRPVSDPSAHRHRRGGHVDGEWGAALGATRWCGAERTQPNLPSERHELNAKSTEFI